jgi:hypothetical protein
MIVDGQGLIKHEPTQHRNSAQAHPPRHYPVPDPWHSPHSPDDEFGSSLCATLTLPADIGDAVTTSPAVSSVFFFSCTRIVVASGPPATPEPPHDRDTSSTRTLVF